VVRIPITLIEAASAAATPEWEDYGWATCRQALSVYRRSRSILLSRRHPEQAFRSCLGILHLSKQYPPTQVEHACQIAREEKSLNYQAVKTLLDLIPPIPESAPLPTHENIRGHSYYQ